MQGTCAICVKRREETPALPITLQPKSSAVWPTIQRETSVTADAKLARPDLFKDQRLLQPRIDVEPLANDVRPLPPKLDRLDPAELSTMLLRRRLLSRCAASWITSGTVSEDVAVFS